MTTVLRHARLLCMNSSMDYFPDGYIAFCGTDIIETGTEAQYHHFPDAQEIDMHGDIVMPALINCHTHLGMAAFRTLGDDMPDRLNRFLFPLENACMTKELVYASSRLCMAELMLAGTAAALDMYYFEDSVMRAAHDMHFRLWAGETLLDAPHCDADGFDRGLRLIESQLALQDDLVTAVCAPHAPYSVSGPHLAQVQQFAKAHGILWSMHVSEMPREDAQCRSQYGCSPIRHLADSRLLDERLIAAHCIYTDPQDIPVIADTGAVITHCPVSNAKAAKGVAPVHAMMQQGICVTLGTDGPSSGNTLDMFTQLKATAILQKNLLKDRSALPAKEIVKLATCNAARALKARIGMLEPGFKADILVLSAHDPNMIPVHDVYSAVVYGAQVQNVKHLWVNGTQTVQDHTLTLADMRQLADDFTMAAAQFNHAADAAARPLS